MHPWLSTIRLGFLVFAAAQLLASCSGDGGPDEVILHFGVNGDGACTRTIVDIDLESVDAVIARDENGAVECAISALAGGCHATFTQAGDGHLRVTIAGCTTDAVSSLFHCGFTDADVSALQSAATAQCFCAVGDCDETPPLCVGEREDPGFCEDCSNHRDDDGNGFLDCADPNCEHSEPCVPTTTSSTSSSSTTSSTTLGSTTSTTAEEVVSGFTLTFGLDDAEGVGSLRWNTYYGAALARRRGVAASPDCEGLVEGATFEFVDDPAQQVLHVSVSGLSGDEGPLELVRCTFDADSLPSAGDFTTVVVEAFDTEGDPIAPPDVEIDDIVVVTTTTTTIFGQTTTTVDTTTTTAGSPPTTIVENPYTVRFRLDSATAAVGALQIIADYSGAPGRFVGSGALVHCTNLAPVDDTLFAPNDDEVDRELILGFITLEAFAAPRDLAECVFAAADGEVPAPSDFPITVVDSTDHNGDPITVAVSAHVTP